MKKFMTLLTVSAILTGAVSCSGKSRGELPVSPSGGSHSSISPEQNKSKPVSTLNSSGIQTVCSVRQVSTPKGDNLHIVATGAVGGQYVLLCESSGKLERYHYNEDLSELSSDLLSDSVPVFDQHFGCFDGEGNIYVLTKHASENYTDGDYFHQSGITFSFTEYDSDCKEVRTIDLPQLDELYSSSGVMPEKIIFLGDLFMMNAGTSSYIFDENGDFTHINKNLMNCGGLTADGQIAGYEYGEIFFVSESGAITGSLPFSDDWIECNMLTGDSEYELFLPCRSGIYGLTPDGGAEIVSDFGKSGAAFESIQSIARCGDSFLIQVWDDGWERLYIVEPKPVDYVFDLRQITVEVLLRDWDSLADMVGSDDRDAVNRFNSISDDYFAAIRSCTSREELTREILSDDSPDVLIYNESLLTGDLMNMGALTDMSAVSGDLLPNVRTALETDGGLYRASDSFRLAFFTADRKLMDRDYGCVGFEQFCELYDFRKPLIYSCYAKSPEELFGMMCCSDYIDSLTYWIDGGSCRFDSPEFVTLLEMCRDAVLPPEYDYSSMDYNTLMSKMKNGQSLISDRLYLTFPSDILYTMESLSAKPDELTFFAGVGSDSAAILDFERYFSVLETGRCREGAMEFAGYLLGEGHQNTDNTNIGGLCTNSSAFDKQIEFARITNLNPDGTSPLPEEYIEKFRDITANSTAVSCCDHYITSICQEEFLGFINGERSAKQCGEIIQNRVSLYLSEHS